MICVFVFCCANGVACCLFVCCVLFAVHDSVSVFVARCALLVVCSLLLVVCDVLCAVCGLLCAVCWWLLVARCLLFVVLSSA